MPVILALKSLRQEAQDKPELHNETLSPDAILNPKFSFGTVLQTVSVAALCSSSVSSFSHF